MAKQLKLTDEFPKTKGSLFDEKKTPSKSVVIKEEIESLTAKPGKKKKKFTDLVIAPTSYLVIMISCSQRCRYSNRRRGFKTIGRV